MTISSGAALPVEFQPDAGIGQWECSVMERELSAVLERSEACQPARQEVGLLGRFDDQ